MLSVCGSGCRVWGLGFRVGSGSGREKEFKRNLLEDHRLPQEALGALQVSQEA